MMRRTHLQEKPLSSSPQVPTKSRFAPRPFAPKAEVREPPSAESLKRAARFGHSFGDVDIFPKETVQPKLVLGPVGDKYEQEADEVARRVVETISSPERDSVQRKEGEDELDLEELEEEAAAQRHMAGAISSSDQESVQMQEDLEDEDELDLEEGEELRRKVAGFAPAGGADVGPDLESSIHRARSGGQPLSDGVRQPMERAFGTDFGGVRVHADGEADSLNRSIQARAFTTGQDIFLRQGEYRPGSSEGQRLLAHELTHVVQQKSNVLQGFGFVDNRPDKTSVNKLQSVVDNRKIAVQRKIDGFSDMQEVAGDDEMWNFYIGLDLPSRTRFREWIYEDYNIQRHILHELFHPNFSRDINWVPSGRRIEAHAPWTMTRLSIIEGLNEITPYRFDNDRHQWVYQLVWSRYLMELFGERSKIKTWKDGHILFSFDLDTRNAYVFHSGPGG